MPQSTWPTNFKDPIGPCTPAPLREVNRIAGAVVFTGPNLEPQRVDIRIDDGKITELAPPSHTVPAADESVVVDARGRFVLPGFIDCHDHLRNLLPGLSIGEGLTLDALLRVMWEVQRHMGPDDYRISALLGAVQRLRAGITTVIDHCYTYHESGLDAATLVGLKQSGIRYAYARGVMTRPYEPVAEKWEIAADHIRRLVGEGVVEPDQLFVAPVSLRQASPDDYQRCVALATELGIGLYTHVAETSAEVDAWISETGYTPIHALDRIGFLAPSTVLVHCIQIDQSEIELLAERNTSAVHCPTNHMKLAKGFTPVPELLAAGVNVAIGVDTMADMLVEIRTEIGLHAIHRGDPGTITMQDALRMATVFGARAIGWGDRIGSIEVGKEADLVVIDGRSVDHGPVIDPHYAIAYTANTGMIRDVLIAGRLVVSEGRCLTVDEDGLLAEAEQLADRHLKRLGLDGSW